MRTGECRVPPVEIEPAVGKAGDLGQKVEEAVEEGVRAGTNGPARKARAAVSPRGGVHSLPPCSSGVPREPQGHRRQREVHHLVARAQHHAEEVTHKVGCAQVAQPGAPACASAAAAAAATTTTSAPAWARARVRCSSSDQLSLLPPSLIGLCVRSVFTAWPVLERHDGSAAVSVSGPPKDEAKAAYFSPGRRAHRRGAPAGQTAGRGCRPPAGRAASPRAPWRRTSTCKGVGCARATRLVRIVWGRARPSYAGVPNAVATRKHGLVDERRDHQKVGKVCGAHARRQRSPGSGDDGMRARCAGAATPGAHP